MLEKIKLRLRLRRLKKNREELMFEIQLQEFAAQHHYHPESLELVVRERSLDLLAHILAVTETKIKEIEDQLSHS